MSQARRAPRVALRITVTAVALTLALRKVSFASLGDRLGHVTLPWALALGALTTAVVALSVARWWRLLRRLGENVPFAALFGDTTVGLLYNLFLPTSVGGDVVRALRARRRVVDPARAWSSSLFERLSGLVTMAGLGAAAAALGGARAGGLPSSVVAASVGLAAALVLLFFWADAPFRFALHALEGRLPAAAAHDARGIVRDLRGPLATAAARGEAVAWSLLYQAASLLFMVAGAAALGAPGHEAALLVGVPLITMLSLAPISLGGHGLREGLYVGVLGALGVPADVAIGLDALWLASSLAFAGVGALAALREPTGVTGGAAPPPGPAPEHT